MEIYCSGGSEKTNPIQSQFGCFTAENAECAEVINVHIGRDQRITGTNLLGGLRDLCGE